MALDQQDNKRCPYCGHKMIMVQREFIVGMMGYLECFSCGYCDEDSSWYNPDYDFSDPDEEWNDRCMKKTSR